MVKERGLKTTLAICAFIFPFAWLVGYGLYHILTYLRVKI
jgi:Fe2+ transport system protein B